MKNKKPQEKTAQTKNQNKNLNISNAEIKLAKNNDYAGNLIMKITKNLRKIIHSIAAKLITPIAPMVHLYG